jgi:hypothetical protein
LVTHNDSCAVSLDLLENTIANWYLYRQDFFER